MVSSCLICSIFFAKSAVSLFRKVNDNGLEIICKNETDIKIFYGDERRLKQALFNLLVNAIKFTPAGGLIELSAGKQDGEDGQELFFIVKDTGVGIRLEDQKRIFNLFETTSTGRQQNGTGLGLPLVKSFIHLHGGQMSLTSQPGEGTTVKCTIPLITHSRTNEGIDEHFSSSEESEAL